MELISNQPILLLNVCPHTGEWKCRSKAVLLLWFLTVTYSCCPYLYFGSAIMLVTYFVNFR